MKKNGKRSPSSVMGRLTRRACRSAGESGSAAADDAPEGAEATDKNGEAEADGTAERAGGGSGAAAEAGAAFDLGGARTDAPEELLSSTKFAEAADAPVQENHPSEPDDADPRGSEPVHDGSAAPKRDEPADDDRRDA